MKTWTCQRVTAKRKCGHRNPSRKRLCEGCGKAKPARRRPAHMAALDLEYAGYIALNGGEFCGVCGRGPTATRRLDRDHDHGTGRPRGLLCSRCNRALPAWTTAGWLAAAIEYLKRTEKA